jgi:hypothetical protein
VSPVSLYGDKGVVGFWLLVVSLWSHCVGWFNRSLSLSGTESFRGVVPARGRLLRWQDTSTAKTKKNRELSELDN